MIVVVVQPGSIFLHPLPSTTSYFACKMPREREKKGETKMRKRMIAVSNKIDASSTALFLCK